MSLKFTGQWRQVVSAYRRAIQFTWQSRPALAAATAITSVLAGLAVPIQIWISKMIIDAVVAVISAGTTYVSWTSLIPPAIAFVIVWTLSKMTDSVSQNLRNLMSHHAYMHGQLLVAEKAASMDLACFDHASFYDQFKTAKDQIWRFYNVSIQLLVMVNQLVMLVSLLLLLGSVHPAYPFIMIICTLPALWVQAQFMRERVNIWMDRVPTQRMADYMFELLVDRDAVKEVRLFQLRKYFQDQLRKSAQAFLTDITRVSLAQERWIALVGILPVIGTASIWIFSALQALASQISIGTFALIFQVLENSRRSLEGVSEISGRLVENTAFLMQFFDFLDMPASSVPGTLKQSSITPQHPPNLHGSIVFSNVSFRYPGADKDVLKALSFTLKPGERVAIVGENGAGKTSLIKMLSRLYDPTEGVITCDGIDLCNLDLNAYQSRIGVILQDFVHYELTVSDNIGFGDIDMLSEDGRRDIRIMRAAKQGGASDMIANLPDQFNTMLGRRFENGTDLSGGQWQMIALSRAFMRDADLLILDEPTAALDAFAEAEVYARFAELTAGKTTVFVTHRLSSVRMADRILVLKDGALVECGNHEALMSLNGEYATMYRLQAEQYQ